MSAQDMSVTEPVVRIGAVARLLGLTPRALRYWEQRGLLPPARRTAGGTRVYGDEHVAAARGVVQLKQAGFSLDDICATQAESRYWSRSPTPDIVPVISPVSVVMPGAMPEPSKNTGTAVSVYVRMPPVIP